MTRIILCAAALLACSCTTVPTLKRQTLSDQAAAPEITAVITENYSEINGGMLGYGFSREKDQARFVKDGAYAFPHGKVTVKVPYLSTGKVSVNMSKNWGRGVEDHQVRFFEGNNYALASWSLDQRRWHAVVVTTQLPAELIGQSDKSLQAAERCARQAIKDLKPDQYQLEKVNCCNMPCIQLSVPGRIPSPLYPQTGAVLASGSWQKEYFGVNRYLVCPDLIIEVGMVISRPADVPTNELGAYAETMLNEFVAGLSINTQAPQPPASVEPSVPAQTSPGPKVEDLTLGYRGWAATQSGNHKLAISLFEECIKSGNLSNSSLAQTYRNLGIAYRRDGRSALAVPCFDRALALNPAEPWADYVNRGNAWDDQGLSDNAMRDYDLALKAKPDYGEAFFNKGIAYERQKKLKEASAEFKKAYDTGLRTSALMERLNALNNVPTIGGEKKGME